MNPYKKLVQEYVSSNDEDSYRRKRNSNQLNLLKITPKVNLDPVLAKNLVDDRLACCIVARPDDEVKSLIAAIQSRIATSVCNPKALWFPSEENLHMSVLEITSSSPKSTLIPIIDVLLQYVSQILLLASNGPELGSPLICLDANAIALSFTSVSKSHLEYRLELYDCVTSYGVKIKPRYYTPSAHITILRFVDDLDEKDINSLIEQIQLINSSITDLKWKISNCEFNYGPIWYGQRLQQVEY